MRQVIFSIPFGSHTIPIYGYGLMLVIGFLLAAHLAKYLAGRCGIDGELFINAALLALFSGIAGARISHILENFSQFTRSDLSVWQNLFNMIDLREGGLTYYGGFLLAFPTLVAYGLWKKIPIRLGMDIIAPCLMIGLGIGRVGCFLNGCCYGAECSPDAVYAVRFPYFSNAYMQEFKDGLLRQAPPAALLVDENGHEQLRSPVEAAKLGLNTLMDQQHSNALHPAQLYSTVTALLLAALCVAFFTVRTVPGHVFAMMMVFEGITRFILEILRSEPAVLGPMSLSMILGILLFVMGIGLWFILSWFHARHPQESRPIAQAPPLPRRGQKATA